MTLTDFVSQENVRERLNTKFPNEGENAENDVAVSWQTDHYMLIGSTFDYLARFWSEKHSTNAHTNEWISKLGLTAAKKEHPEKYHVVKQHFSDANKSYNRYVNDEADRGRGLIESALDLARIDRLYRDGNYPDYLGTYDNDDIVDCVWLMDVLDSNRILEGTDVFLNPTFGGASTLVGGADADIVIDGTLVEIKTTENPRFKLKYWRQLVGYLILADIQNDIGEMDIGFPADDKLLQADIDSFGVYFARHSELQEIDADVIYTHPNYEKIKQWFVKNALEEYSPPTEVLENLIERYD